MTCSSQHSRFPATVSREELHFRRIDMRAYLRGDGLYEVEGRVTDRKPHKFTPASGGRTFEAGEPLHDMGVRLVFDETMTVREVHTFTDAAPYGPCSNGGNELQSLKGMQIGRGWNSEVKRRLADARTCAHLKELLAPMATTAIQMMMALRMNEPEPLNENERPRKINSCYAYAEDGEIVKRRWPQYFLSTEST
ncbi:DUF2889 domain-containing protein [Paraburkholderia dipogonis]|uniref:DUF2889 domain-containing protein n=1 Tax=Paraburkholderia dipogonis TaxID=1211383 RepID=UPI0038BE06C5